MIRALRTQIAFGAALALSVALAAVALSKQKAVLTEQSGAVVHLDAPTAVSSSSSCEPARPIVTAPAEADPNPQLDLNVSAAGTVIHLRTEHQKPIDAIVIVNGSDLVEEPVTLFEYSDSTTPASFPTWKSADYGFHSGACTGDLDGNGSDDLVVTVLGNRAEDSGVKAYYGTGFADRRRVLEATPRWLAKGLSATGCAIADVDGNGQADVVFGTISESTAMASLRQPGLRVARRPGAGIGPFRSSGFLNNGTVRFALNIGRPSTTVATTKLPSVPPTPSACPKMAFSPSALLVRDLNRDGRQDLIVGGSRIAVWFGKDLPVGTPQFAGDPDWYSQEEYAYTPGLDVAFLPQWGREAIVASRSCTSAGDDCCIEPSGYFLYDP